MGKYQGYEKYKDSSVKWLGEIPEHWEVKRVKYAFILQRGYDLSRDEMEEGKYPVCASNGIIGYHTSFNVKAPSITVGRSGSVGEINYISQDFWAHNTALYVKNFIKSEPRFIFYLLKTLDVKALSWGTAVGTLNRNYIHDLLSGFPSLHEQKTIAQFLDHKTKQIDELIAKKEALLEKLDEKRTALISHAVTKGLDPNVPMKDSGIEWLGEIPKHWKVSRPKYLCSKIVDGTHQTPEYIDFGIPFLTVKNLTVNHGISFENLKYISLECHQELSKRANPQKGDILITKDGTLGVTRVVETETEFSIFVSLALLKPYHFKINSYYFRDVLESKAVSAQFESRKEGSALKHIHLVELANVFIPLPPLLEQEKIRNFTTQRTAEIDQQKAKIQQAIELLKEYRTALITNAVTGKIDVRQVPIP